MRVQSCSERKVLRRSRCARQGDFSMLGLGAAKASSRAHGSAQRKPMVPSSCRLLSCSMMGSCGEREGQFCRPRCPRQDQLPSFARDWSSSVMCGTSLCEVCAAMGMTRGRPSGGKRLAPCSRFGKRFWVLCGRGGCAFGSLLLWGEREERYANDDEYSRSDQLPLRDYLVECLNSHERGVSYVRPRCVQD